MQTTIIVLCVAVAAANAGLLPFHETGTLLKGPSARSTIVGADGLGVSTVFEGGVVAPTQEVAVALPEVVVARAEPLVYAEPILAYPETIIARQEPIISYAEPLITRHEPLIAPVLEHGRSDIIAGPSGTIITNQETIAPIVPLQREILVEPSLRTVLPIHGFNLGRDLYSGYGSWFDHGLYNRFGLL